MKTILALFLWALATTAAADQYVSPHVRSDGTFVGGYMRSSPNSTTLDNYSTRGNTNPYTGERGYQSPYNSGTGSYSAPSYNSPGSTGYGSYGSHRYGTDRD